MKYAIKFVNKLLQLKCCINIQDNTNRILVISYVKVNDGNIMLLLVASQTLPVRFAHERKFLKNFSIIANLFCNLVGVSNLVWTHACVLFVAWPGAAEHLEEIWTKQGKYWIQLWKSSLQPIYIYIWKAYESQNSIKTLDLLYLFLIAKYKIFNTICFLGFKHTDWYRVVL